MELYIVAYKRDIGDVIEIGKCIVTGDSVENAIQKAAYHSDLNERTTTFKCTKLKPQIFSLDRAKIKKTSSPGKGLPIKRSIYSVSIDGQVSATDEIAAVMAISHFSIEKAKGKDGRAQHNVIEFDARVEKVASPTNGLSQPYVEKQAIYKNTQIFSGGGCSPR